MAKNTKEMVGLWRAFVLSLLVIGAVESAVVQFNTSVDCSAIACNVWDAGIWVNGVVPTANDTVEVIAPQNGNLYTFIVSNPTTYFNLAVQNIILNIQNGLTISNNLTVIDSNVTMFSGSSLNLLTNTSFLGNSNISVLESGRLVISIKFPVQVIPVTTFGAATNFLVDGIVLLYGEAYFYGSIFASLGSSLSFYASCTYAPVAALVNSLVTFLGATIPANSVYSFPRGALFSNLTIGDNSNITIYNRASIYNLFYHDSSLVMGNNSALNLVNVYASPTSGDVVCLPTGPTGKINVFDSDEIYFAGNPYDMVSISIPLYFSGQNNITLYACVVQDISFAEGASITISSSNLRLINTQPTPLHIPGSLDIYYGDLRLNGSFTFDGGLECDAAKIYSTANTLTFGGPINLYGERAYNDNTTIAYPSSWNLTGLLATPQLTVYNSSIIRVSGDLQINGNLSNVDGNVQIAASQSTLINGAYSQGPAGNLTVYGIDLPFNSSFNATARLTSQTANIAGQLHYSYSKLSGKSRFAIIQVLVNGSLNGTFTQKATALTGSIKTLDIDYNTANFVYAVYNTPMKLGPLVWYYWVIIGAGVLIVLIAVIAFFKLRSKSDYEPVRK